MLSTPMARVIAAAEEGRRAGAPPASLADRRARMRANADRLPAADGVTVEPVDAGGVPCEWISPATVAHQRVIVYLHGGGFAVGELATHRKLVGHLATAAAMRALSVGYRLSPEHAFPAAIDDGLTVLEWLSAQGIDVDDVVLAGDSAGGGLALAVAVARRDRGEPLPSALVLLSPWLDMAAAEVRTDDPVVDDPIVGHANLAELRDWYLAGADPAHPWASPLLADQTGMPPTLVQVGGRELLRADAERLHRRMIDAGVDATCQVWDGLVHVWHFFAGLAPEADDAITAVAEWLRGQHPATARGVV